MLSKDCLDESASDRYYEVGLDDDTGDVEAVTGLSSSEGVACPPISPFRLNVALDSQLSIIQLAQEM